MTVQWDKEFLNVIDNALHLFSFVLNQNNRPDFFFSLQHLM